MLHNLKFYLKSIEIYVLTFRFCSRVQVSVLHNFSQHDYLKFDIANIILVILLLRRNKTDIWHYISRTIERLECNSFVAPAYIAYIMRCVLHYERVYVHTCLTLSIRAYIYYKDNSVTVRANAKLLSIEVLTVERHSSANSEIKSNV